MFQVCAQTQFSVVAQLCLAWFPFLMFLSLCLEVESEDDGATRPPFGLLQRMQGQYLLWAQGHSWRGALTSCDGEGGTYEHIPQHWNTFKEVIQMFFVEVAVHWIFWCYVDGHMDWSKMQGIHMLQFCGLRGIARCPFFLSMLDENAWAWLRLSFLWTRAGSA